MNLYTLVLSLHVTVAILGLGPLMAVAILTRRPPVTTSGPRIMPPAPALRGFLRLLRISQVSLGLMFITGAAMIAIVHGAFGHRLWMIVSVVLFLGLGGIAGLTQRCFKKALMPSGTTDDIESAHRSLLTMCVIVAAIAWLMEAKPF